MTLDQTMYLVVVDHPKGPYIPETDLDRTSLSTVCKDLRDGQYPTPLAVIEINPALHICRDATHDFEPLLEGRSD